MKTVSLLGTAACMPETVVENDHFGEGLAPTGAMFQGTRLRRHVQPEDSASDLIVRATKDLCERLDLSAARDIDIILTNVSIPDLPFTGCGADVAHALGSTPEWVLDVQNTGCVSFVYMMQLANSLIQSSAARTALICNVQTAGGRVFGLEGNRQHPQSAVPGDGCGVGIVAASEISPIRSIVTQCHGEFAGDMQVVTDDARRWWEPGEDCFRLDFSRRKVAGIVRRGNRLVPGVVQEACRQASLPTEDIDLLVTNQPNAFFLRNWREALQVPKERHPDTFSSHGNLFGAAIPVVFDQARQDGLVEPGNHVVMGGFSHAGDYAAAAVVHWQAGQAGVA